MSIFLKKYQSLFTLCVFCLGFMFSSSVGAQIVVPKNPDGSCPFGSTLINGDCILIPIAVSSNGGNTGGGNTGGGNTGSGTNGGGTNGGVIMPTGNAGGGGGAADGGGNGGFGFPTAPIYAENYCYLFNSKFIRNWLGCN